MSVPTSPANPQLAAVIVAAAGGDESAFSQLYQRFAPKIYNLVVRSVRNAPAAEDLCQEVWVRAYQKLPQLRDPAAFSTWLYRMASRACIDRARASARVGAGEELPEQLVAPADDSPEQATIQHERERVLWQALGALPARQHLALFLREVEGLSYQEMAGVLNTTPSAIETLLFRARRGVGEAFERLQSVSERCGQAKKTMAVLIDGEATLVQRQAVLAHVDECRRCRGELGRFRRASEAYGMLPLLPLPALLAQRVLQEIGTATVSAASGGALAKLLALFTAKVKLTTAALTIIGGIAVATIAVPGDSLPPGAATSAEVAASADHAAAARATATASALLGVTTAQVDLDLSSAAAAIAALRQLSEQVGTAFPALSGLSQTPAAALDQLAALLTPLAVPPTVPPPAVTPPLALPTVAPPQLPLP
ncbi:MAG: sigma-70 family RNA polymerase sigma factor [Chloroflexi bacterium]|nr:sigma-70 family RNA polymerase sigma factor [Chloroflexota bacterium]